MGVKENTIAWYGPQLKPLGVTPPARRARPQRPCGRVSRACTSSEITFKGGRDRYPGNMRLHSCGKGSNEAGP